MGVGGTGVGLGVGGTGGGVDVGGSGVGNDVGGIGLAVGEIGTSAGVDEPLQDANPPPKRIAKQVI